MSGWTHEDLPEGMTYEGVPSRADDAGGDCSPWRRERYFGETGAQSSVIPALDAALGISMPEDELSPYLKAMRSYMPPHHAEFIEAIENGPSIRAAVLSVAEDLIHGRDPIVDANNGGERAQRSSSGMGLVEAYNGCLRSLSAFRGTHLELAYSFVRKFDERKDEEIRGTGGTPFMPYLRKHWRGTNELAIHADWLNGGH